METDFENPVSRPLSDEERGLWEHLVSAGREIREPMLSRREEKRALQLKRLRRLAEENGRPFRDWRKEHSSSDALKDIPVEAKRWVILRFAGVPFAKAAESSGATWAQVQVCRDSSEEFRCAFAAQEESSRKLMLAKAQSTLESSQDEGSRVSMTQAQLAAKILSSLDRENFGEERFREPVEAEGEAKALGNGGFVINLIADAAKVAEAVPAKGRGKALVYTDV